MKRSRSKPEVFEPGIESPNQRHSFSKPDIRGRNKLSKVNSEPLSIADIAADSALRSTGLMEQIAPLEHSRSQYRPLLLALPGTLLVLCCLVPFLNKAFTIDDPDFLLEARQILKSPLQPMSFP